ncbi:MAG: choice-of-anchor B family protein [Flavobacteriales bacterium]|nr:choice-of-anchor B family protein [Flavobacteriales bacterium]
MTIRLNYFRFKAAHFFTAAFFLLWVAGYSQSSKNITLAGHLPYDTCLSALWGYTDPSGNEYAIVGTCDGTSIVNITNPATPQEVYFVPGPGSIWREMKTYKHYAYVVTEGGGGLTIINLQNLPDTNLSYTQYSFTGEGVLNNGHTIWIDEFGKCFIFGATGYTGTGGGGCVILNLEPDPENPVLFGKFGWPYLHDGFVRGDTLYGAAIYEGFMGLFKINGPFDIEFNALQNTPGNFTHNAWPSNDNKFIFTTDEVADGYITAYDISDWFNVKELGRIQMDPLGGETPHNVRYLNGWLPTAYYREGVVIVDAHKPDNMVITGYYDTFPTDTGSNFWGVWEAYPYFPSGRIIAGDRTNGLFILNPSYVRACYLEGLVTDTSTGLPISGANIFFSGLYPGDSLFTKVDGSYKTGAPDSGLYFVTVAKEGYISKSFYANLNNGETVEKDIALRPIGYVPPPPAEDYSQLWIYPVPASDVLHITGIPFTVSEIKMVDMQGKTVLNFPLNNTPFLTVRVSELAAGTYTLFFYDKGKKPKVKKIMVLR